MDVNRIALEAARAFDEGDCRAVKQLFEQLVGQGVPEQEVRDAFRAEGAGIELLPANGHYYGMLSAVKG